MYGGEGVFNGHKIGRYLKNITFSGKGLTKKPANPESVIFTDIELFDEVFASADILNKSVDFGCADDKSGVNNNNNQVINEEIIMADTALENIEKENLELKAQIATLTEQLEKFTTENYPAKIEELTNSLATKDTALTRVNETIVAKDAEITALKSTEAELKQKYTEAEEKISSLSVSVTKAQRTISLYQYDIDPGDAADIVNKFISLADEQFNDMVALIVKNKAESKVEKPIEPIIASASEVIDSATSNEPEIPLPVKTETESKLQKAVADVREIFSVMLNKKK
jgi:hypothetical protein